MIVVLRALSPELMDEALNGLGVEVHNRTPYLETTTGISCSFFIFPDQMEKLPAYIDPPNVLCDYRQDEEGGVVPVYEKLDGSIESAGWFS